MYFGCCIYVLLLLNMQEMAHDWINESILFYSSFAIILIGKRELVALLCLSSCYFVIGVWLCLRMPWVCLQFVIVVFPDHTHLLFCIKHKLGIFLKQNTSKD